MKKSRIGAVLVLILLAISVSSRMIAVLLVLLALLFTVGCDGDLKEANTSQSIQNVIVACRANGGRVMNLNTFGPISGMVDLTCRFPGQPEQESNH